MKKNRFYALAAFCLVASAATVAQNLPVVYEPGTTVIGLSDNGVYALSATEGDTDVDNPKGAGGTLLNLKTKETLEIGTLGGWAEVNDVSDEGIVVGALSGKPGYWDPATQDWTTFDVPSDWSGGCFTAVTPDAHYGVGYLTDKQSEYFVHPMFYDLTTGQMIDVPNIPKRDMTGLDQKQNLFYGISPDGRYLLGQMSQSYWMPVALFSYVYDMDTHTWDPIGFDYDDATGKFTPQHENLYFTSTQHMSCDGKWVAGNAYMVFDGGSMENGTEGIYPYKYNVETKEFTVYDSTSDADVGGNKVAPDGTLLGNSPSANPYPTAQVRSNGFFISLDDIFLQVYGKTNEELIHDTVTGVFQALSADGLTAVMATYDNCYILTMPESFAEAAAKVDLLKNYTLSIPEGSTIGQIGEIQITFDRAVECLSYPQNISLTDKDGNVVRNAIGFAVSNSSDNRIVLTFRTTTLTPGMEYHINIPEGMIWLKADSSRKTKAMTITYTGREEGPIKVVSMNPADGTTIPQFNSSPDYLVVTFNTPVAISENGSCTLYNADDDSVVGTFSAAVDGNSAIFYPTSSYLLYKGSNYRLVISEGTVTDLSGKGGCEEITLEYQGAYVRQLSDDDLYIFYSDCDDYSNFIYWQTDFDNQLASKPLEWGFEAGNPWILIRDNSSSENQALAAHSMFSPAAESNDWLVTPQLYIPDENVFLTFDAQSYMRSKTDTLRVYVYEYDTPVNYFSAELEAAFRADGDLIMAEKLSAGDTDEGLDYEWTNYTFDLAKYAGKNIYIAFVNQNYDGSAIFIDDVKVIRNLDFVVTNQTPSSIVDADNVSVKGIVSIGSQINTFYGIEVTLLDAEDNVVDKISNSNIYLEYEDTYNFAFDTPLTLEKGVETKYSIVVKSEESTSRFDYAIKNLTFEPTKRVVLEEYTGSSCPNCPLGVNAIENLLKLYPDNFIPVTLRTYGGDMHTSGVAGYADYLGMPSVGAPSGRVNRGKVLSPMVQTSTGYLFNGRGIINSDGEEVYLWADAVQDELETPAEAAVELTVHYNTDTREVEVPINVTFAVSQTNKSYSLLGVVMENKLITYQDNNLYAISDPNLGEWGAGGMYASSRVYPWEANEVGRFVLNGSAYNGTPITQSDFTANETCSMTLSAVANEKYISDPANCYVVVMLIDRSTERIVNANTAAFNTSGITDVEIDTDSDATPVYYDLQGIQVTNPRQGNIYIEVKGKTARKVRF